MAYREHAVPPPLRELAECVWTTDARPGVARVLPDGCMDLMDADEQVVVAGPDTEAFVTDRSSPTVGVRFRPGVLPRLLGVPAHELVNTRVPLSELMSASGPVFEVAAALAERESTAETSPWSLPALRHVTSRLGAGSSVSAVADEMGCTTRTMQRHCTAVFGYGPAMLRRILRFRAAVRLVDDGLPKADAAFTAGYADQPHMHREVRALAGVPLSQLSSGANRSIAVPSGSVTVA